MTDSKDRVARHCQSVPARRRYGQISTITLNIVFTVVQTWAVVVVIRTVHVSEPAHAALAIALAGTFLAVVDVWQPVRKPGRYPEYGADVAVIRRPNNPEPDGSGSASRDVHGPTAEPSDSTGSC